MENFETGINTVNLSYVAWSSAFSLATGWANCANDQKLIKMRLSDT